MSKILVIPNSDFSRNCIVKVDITNKVEKTVDNQTPISYGSSTLNSSLKIMFNNNDYSKQI